MHTSKKMQLRLDLIEAVEKSADFDRYCNAHIESAAEEWLVSKGLTAHHAKGLLGKKTRTLIRQARARRIPSSSPKNKTPERNPSKQFAKVMQVVKTESEDIVWKWLSLQNHGGKWKFQHPVGGYVIDFYHPKTKTGLELDGKIHQSQGGYDARRDADLKMHGIKIKRIPSYLVFSDRTFVFRTIAQMVQGITQRVEAQRIPSATALLDAARRRAEKEKAE